MNFFKVKIDELLKRLQEQDFIHAIHPVKYTITYGSSKLVHHISLSVQEYDFVVKTLRGKHYKGFKIRRGEHHSYKSILGALSNDKYVFGGHNGR